jgi:hypothetical protein
MATLTLNPIESAIDRLGRRSVVASKIRTADWEKVPVALRERAFFSAGIDDLRVLQSMKEKLVEWQAQLRTGPEDRERALMSREKFVADMRDELAAAPGDTGDLTDLTSAKRLRLIYDFQTQDAAEFARWQLGNDPDLLDAFPAQELIRLEDRKVPRDWELRWAEAGGQLYGGRMIALKNDPIWARISRFEKPWPPFDFGSGMGVEDVSREEAVDAGLDVPEVMPIEDREFNDSLEANLADMDHEFQSKADQWFGDQIERDGDKVKWV